MADVQTTDINTKPTVTAIDSNDQIYISDGGTALKKISYTNLAKAIIEQYNASQLAGATKTIQTAINDLNNNGLYDRGGIINNVDLNTYKTPGLYYCSSTGGSNFPTGMSYSAVLVEVSLFANGGGVCQVCIDAVGSSKRIWRRYFVNNAWSAWVKQPERDEIETLNSKLTLTGEYNSSESFSSAETLGSKLDELLNAQSSYVVGCYRLSCTASFGVFQDGYDYYVQMTRASSLNFVMAEFTPIDNGLIKILGKRRTEGWSFELAPSRTEINTLNSKLFKQIGTNLSDEAFNALTADGLYVGYIPTTSCPCKQQWAYIYVKRLSANANDVIQEVVGITSAIVCTRMKNSGTWGNWVLTPYFRESGGNATLDYIGTNNALRHFTITDSGIILYDSSWNILSRTDNCVKNKDNADAFSLQKTTDGRLAVYVNNTWAGTIEYDTKP